MGNVSFVCIPCHWWEIYGIVFSKLHRHHVKPPMSSTCYHKNRKHRGGIQVFPGHSLGPREVKHTWSLIIQSHHPKKTVTDLPNCLLAFGTNGDLMGLEKNLLPSHGKANKVQRPSMCFKNYPWHPCIRQIPTFTMF